MLRYDSVGGTHYCVRNKDKAIERLAVALKLYTEPEKSDYKTMVANGYAFFLSKVSINGLSTELIWFCTSRTSDTDF